MDSGAWQSRWENEWHGYAEALARGEEEPSIVSEYIERVVASRSEPQVVSGTPSPTSRAVTHNAVDTLPRYDGESMQRLVSRQQARDLEAWIGPLAGPNVRMDG